MVSCCPSLAFCFSLNAALLQRIRYGGTQPHEAYVVHHYYCALFVHWRSCEHEIPAFHVFKLVFVFSNVMLCLLSFRLCSEGFPLCSEQSDNASLISDISSA